MEQHNFNRFPIIGLVLVLLGIALLLNQMDVIHIGGWSLVWLGLLIYGAAVVIRSFINNDRSKVFFGTLCFLSGILFFFRKENIIHGTFSIYFPAFIIIVGLAFFMLFVFNMNDWHLLIPSFIFLGLGAALMLTHLGYWYSRDVWHTVGSYWPLILILVGGTMLVRRWRT
ncbi:MAG TPA: hypothetical protein VMM58_07310 [Bacteroidota bacterium]|nr:hypothetical protein [Bacteroidota bacterium]